MKKVLANILLVFTFPFKLLKQTKIDYFVGGLIFGAVFSLVVNVATVRVQEDLNKQRALEALEREIVFHSLMANDLVREENRVYEANDDEYLSVQNTLSRRYEMRIWESENIPAYIFELEPDTAAEIESYYSSIISNANRWLDDNEEKFKQYYNKCSPYRELVEGVKMEDKPICNALARNAVTLHAGFSGLVYEYVIEIRKDFHPTQDRLNSWWLKLLLGDKAYEVVKLPPVQ